MEVILLLALLSGLGEVQTTSNQMELDCNYQRSTYKNEELFKEDCNVCACRNGRVYCTLNSCDKELVKRWGYQCETEDGRLFNVGAKFNIQCNLCTCLDGYIMCIMKPCRKYLSKKDTEGCAYDGKSYMEDEKFKIGCDLCQCKAGEINCWMNECVNYLDVKRQAGCEFKYTFYREEEQFEDGCNFCRCSYGNVHCKMDECRKKSWITDGKCIFKGEVYLEGEIFPQKCNNCLCSSGMIMCSKAKCDDKGKTNPPRRHKGAGCNHNEIKYRNHDSFNEQCNSCLCEDGLVYCTVRICSWNSR